MAECQEGEEPELSYKEIMSQITGTFQDEGFPADQRTILTQESVFELNEDEVQVLQSLEYARAKEIFSDKRYKLFDQIEPNGIRQG